MPDFEHPPIGVFEYLAQDLGGAYALGQAGLGAATDFLTTGELKDWSYYAGILTGTFVSAASNPLAALAFYAIGEAVDVLILKSPEGSQVDLFLDGVAQSTITTYASNQVWDTIRININKTYAPARVELRNSYYDHETFGGDARNWAWMGIGSIALVGATELLQRPQIAEKKPWLITFTFKDDRGRYAKTKAYLPYFCTSEQVTAWTNEAAKRFNAVIDGALVGVNIMIDADAALPDDIRAQPEPTSDVATKADFKFKALGSRSTYTLSLPTFDKAFTDALVGTKTRILDWMQSEVEDIREIMTTDPLNIGAVPLDARGYTLADAVTQKSTFKYKA